MPAPATAPSPVPDGRVVPVDIRDPADPRVGCGWDVPGRPVGIGAGDGFVVVGYDQSQGGQYRALVQVWSASGDTNGGALLLTQNAHVGRIAPFGVAYLPLGDLGLLAFRVAEDAPGTAPPTWWGRAFLPNLGGG